MVSTSADHTQNNFIVVANRLPVDVHTEPDGNITMEPSPGGLVTALSPVLESQQGCWVGWPGIADQPLDSFRTDEGVLLYPIELTAAEYENFYEGFSNATLWPLYHDLIVTPTYRREWWAMYREVNLKFAETVAHVAAEGATVWVQDYQLQLVPGILRQLRPDLTIGFFLHIPFPSGDLYRQLPWRDELTRGLLGADLIGFHLEQDATNFLDVAASLKDTEVEGAVSVRESSAKIICPDGHEVGVGAFPISIDVDSVSLPSPEDVKHLRKKLGNPDTLILGVDRLDYTKGILQRLRAYEELLASDALPGRTVLLQVATPSRERIDNYRETRAEVEQAVGRINGKFAELGRPVVEYFHRSFPKNALAVMYKAADIMLVTPLKDGMNLVAKEYVAAHPSGSGALVLSEFAGAAVELNQAYLCNPFDLEGLKRSLRQAVMDVHHNPEEAKERMLTMHNQVQEHDVNRWADAFLTALRKA
ncbi:alpha,alpha-trehalose-phosphate synthase [Corynebacterium renale]|uniref:alpha,alpha-trehalose-phosphate synthase (ADP-forming) n=1 Tax=Corynebacterium renale TaxID=1724 RepID=A0A2A9DPC1_9CORY|nr:trehalose-6-phosphate synthase [Corynebacterium renale]PFG28025.1 trehalose 6-phosphate synthase [Corynebacterium renale]SQG65388.1 alpha,alpha-trehalose-phosphate synthase [Corynebacterium renale]SQI21276.1 alpha,alpha-trehalose-phosphate synthase [Corynebacterium renale]STC99116.1 alpha,alpha-trehalose-phosphate synthase [Corynebacterium renale]